MQSFIGKTDAETSYFELLLETGKAIASEVDLQKLVQRVTDIATQITGAQFGAFFYNVINSNGEQFLLYTISGVPKEAFSKFPMPRNTAIFHPTFTGAGTVRYEDVTLQPHYGQNEPFYGMPKGHLPVRSYLATPVISPLTKEVIGGLFFGHSEPGVFTQRHERLVEGIAAQTAIAMGNARLFEEKNRTEQKLREQREQYRSIFQSTTDAMIIYDEEGLVTEANTAAERILGCTLKDLIGTHGKDIIQGQAGQFDAIREVVISGRRYHGTTTYQKKSGEKLEIQIVGTYFLHKGQKHLLTVLKDITQDKRTQEVLRRTEEFSQIITKASPVALWMSNTRGELIYVNETWVEWTGRPAKEHMANGWISSVLEEDRQQVFTEFMAAVQQRKPYQGDFRLLRGDGQIRWCTAAGSPSYNMKGTFEGYAGSCMDITDRKEAEAKLQSQNILINTLTNNTLQALFMMDERQHCRYMNPAAEKMTGFKLEEVQQKPLHYYIHHTHPDGRHFPLEDCPIDRALPTRMQTQGEEIFIRKNGEFFPVAFVASPILDNGKPIGTVIEAWETTEEKRIQEELRNGEKKVMEMLEQKVKERTAELEKINYELLQFTSVASHDLKEPVRKVSIFGSRLKELCTDHPDPQFNKYLDNIIASSRRMAQLIDDLLAFSRLSQTNIPLEEVDLTQLMHQIIDDLQVQIQEKEARILFEGLPIVKGIPLQLGQVFQNLVSNSLKFSHAGRSPVIEINCSREGSFYKITYTDNGIGFAAEHAERIFELFERLHSRDRYEGTGIGLAIAKKIVSLHGGEIYATGRNGEGATFIITLPVPEGQP